MEHIFWTPQLELGIPEIDAQHRRIVELANQMYEAAQKHDGTAAAAVVDGAVEYAVSHFKYEEELMQAAGYGLLRAHVWVHEQFIRNISLVRARGKAGEDVTRELYDLLTGWLIKHIGREDRGYVDSVRAWLARTDATEREGFWRRLHHSTLAVLFPDHPHNQAIAKNREPQ